MVIEIFKAYANQLMAKDLFEHDKSGRNGAGENLAKSRGMSESVVEEAVRATQSWYREINDPGYDFNNPGRKKGTGHFTQVRG